MSGRKAKAQRREIRGRAQENPLVRVSWKQGVAAAGLAAGALAPVTAYALPEGGTVAAGSAVVSTPTATSMRVDQATQSLIMDWMRFNIASNESVRFQQPNAAAIALNRVSGNEASAIYGSLSANGRLFLVNPSGILFGAGSRVDVGGLTASTMNITNADFLAGNYRFFQDPNHANAAVVNQGTINIGPHGYAAFLGAGVRNEGVVQANLGSVVLASGSGVTLDMRGDDLIGFVVTDAVSGGVVGPSGESLASYVSNSGTLQADGGMVALSARAASDVIKSVVNTDGIIRANTFEERNGEIYLTGGDQGIVSVSGTVDASGTGAGQTGGTVQATGQYVGLFGGHINVSGDAGGGTALVGGDLQGKNPDVQNAFRTYVSPDSTINADALTAGHGGKVIVWADDVTRYYGSISARGGAQSGDGGFAEVSGKESLVFRGTVDLRAADGTAGTLLLDPRNIDIVTTSADFDTTAEIQTADTFAEATATDVAFQASAVVVMLNTANVTFQASNDITLTEGLDASGNAGNFGLTLEAGRSILLNNSMALRSFFTATANSSNANVVEGDRTASTAGVFTMANTAGITTGAGAGAAAGDITINMSTGDAAGVGFDSGDITISNLTTATAAHVLINQGGQTAGSDIVRTATSLIIASSAALDISNAGNTTGVIGAVASPINVTVTNLEARTQGGNAFFNSPAQGVNIGSATLGGLTGINVGTGSATLTAAAFTVTQSEAITAGTLDLRGAGATYTLGTQNNAVTTLDADTNQLAALSFRDDTGFDVAGINSAGAVTLSSDGTVTQSAAISGTTLTLTSNAGGGSADFTLNTQANTITTLDANNVSLNTVSFRDDGGFSVAGINADTDATLSSNGTVTQTDVISVPNLTLTSNAGGGSADFTLNTQANTITTLDANNAFLDTVDFRDDDGFDVAGINSFGGATLTSDGTVTQSAAISGSTLTLGSNGNAGTAIFTLDTQANTVGTLFAGVTSKNTVSFRDDGGFNVGGISATTAATLSSDGTVTQSVVISVPSLTLTAQTAGSGDFQLNTQNNVLGTVSSTNLLNTALLRDDAGFAVGTLSTDTSVTLHSDGTVTQTGVLTAPALTLTAQTAGSGDFQLNTQNNVLGTVSSTNLLNTALLRDDADLTVGALTTDTSVTLHSDGTVTQTGVLTAPALTLTAQTAGSGDFQLNTQNNVLGTVSSTNLLNTALLRDDADLTVGALTTDTSVTLSSDGTVTQSAAIATGTLTLTSNGNAGTAIFTLNGFSNPVTTLDANNASLNTVSFRDDTGYDVAGITTTGPVTLTSPAGAITISQNISSTAGPVDIQAAGGVTVNDAVTVNSGTGTLLVNADSDANGAGTLTLTGTGTLTSANTTTSAITIRAQDISLSGTSVVSATGGGGGIRIFNSVGTANIHIGAVGGSGLSLDDAELNRLTDFDTLTIGESGVQSGKITFVTAAHATVTTAAIVANSNFGAGIIELDDDAAGTPATALNGGSGTIALNAGSGGITATNTSNTFAEIATTGATVTMNTSGPVGSITKPIQFADNANPAQQRVVVGSVTGPTVVWLDGLGTLTLGNISANANNANVFVTARGGLNVDGAILSGTGKIRLGADRAFAADANSVGAAGDGTGTLSLLAGSNVTSANTSVDAIRLRGADMEIDATASVTATGAAGGVQIFSSVDTRAMSIGGGNAAVTGINLTDAELARISDGDTLTFGEAAAQSGAITFTTAASPSAGAAIVVNSNSGTGGIVLDDGANTATALNAGTGTITLTAGTGGVTATSASDNIVTNTAEIATTAATVSITTTGPVGTTTNAIQFANNATATQQVVSVAGPASQVFLDGLGTFTVNNISVAGTGAIRLRAANQLNIVAASVIQTGDNMAGGSITMQSNFDNSGAGVTAGEDVVIGAAAQILTRGAITISADPNLDANGGTITLPADAVLAGPTLTLADSISLTGTGDVTLGSLSATTSISARSTLESVLDDLVETTIITAPSITLTAAKSIGSKTTAIVFDAVTGTFTNTQDDAIDIDLGAGALTLVQTTAASNGFGNIQIREVNGSISTSSLTATTVGTNNQIAFLLSDPTGARALTVDAPLNVTATNNNLFLATTDGNTLNSSSTVTVNQTGGQERTFTAVAAPFISTTGVANLAGAAALNVTGIVNAGSNIILASAGNGAGAGVLVNNVVTSSIGTITVTSHLDLSLGSTSALNTTAQPITVTADSDATGAGLLTLGGNITSTNGAVSLSGVGIAQTGGTVNAGNSTILVDANDGAINMSGALTTTNNTATAIRIIDGTTAALGDITAASGQVVLGEAAGDNLSGAISQNTGKIITASSLSIVGGSTITLTNANVITTLLAVERVGAFSLTDSTLGLTVTGPVTAGTTTNAVTISTAGGNLTVNGAISGDDINLTATGAASDVVVAAALTGTGAAGKTLTVRADDDIKFNAGAGVTTTNAFNVELNSDRDASGAGGILVGAVSIASNGGNITLGGGANPATTAAVGSADLLHGVTLFPTATLTSGAGNISLRGTGLAGSSVKVGVTIDGGSTVQSTTGTITIVGTGGAGTNDNYGVNLAGTSLVTSSGGAITITGTGGNGTGANNYGVVIQSGADVTYTGAVAGTQIQITGTGAGNGGGSNSDIGVFMTGDGSTVTAANNAGISITGSGANNAAGDQMGVRIGGGADVITAGGNVTVAGTAGAAGTGNSFGVHLVTSTGTLSSVQSTGAGAISITGTGSATAAGIDLQLGTNTISSATGNIVLQSLGGTGIRFGAGGGTNSVATAGNVTLNAVGGGTVSQTTGTDSITAAGLELLGAGATHTLTSAANNVTTLAGNTGTVSFRDDSGGFDIGTVNTIGLTTTGNTTLSSTSTVTQSQAIVAAGLDLQGVGGTYTLNLPNANAITTLAGNTGVVTFVEAGSFFVGTVGSVGLMTTGAIQLSAVDAISVIQAVNAGGTVTINANTAGADANGYAQIAGITTTNATAAAVAINVNNNLGGTGGAALHNITTGAGGTITVTTAAGGNVTGGSISQTAATLLNSGAAGTVALTTGGPTSGITGILTTADTITATTGTGGVSITETDGASFTATATGAGNISLTSTSGTLTIAGATNTGTGTITLSSGDAVTLNAALGDATDGTITIMANTNGAGAEGFTQNVGGTITTGNAGGGAVAISVNAAGGGTGAAALNNITTGAGGTITVTTATGVNATGGSITQTAATLLNSGAAGTVVLATGGAASGIGTGGANILTTADTITASAGSGGVFITETDGASFTVVTVTGGGTVNLTSTAGNALVGAVNAAGGTVVVTAAAGAIEESGADAGADIVATTIDLNAGTGIGAAGQLEITGAALTIDSTTGNVDVDNIATAATTVTTLMTGTGSITFDQSGGQTLAVTTATTTDGAIVITNDGGTLTATAVTAGGTGRNITLTTTTSGDVFVGLVDATGDTVTVTAVGAIEESGADAGADIVAATIVLNAGTGIGAAGTLEITGTASTLSANTTNGNIDIDSLAVAAMTATSLTTGTGSITFDQTGGQTLAVTTATTGNGAVVITNDAGNLSVGTLTAGGANSAALTTTTSGDLSVTTLTAGTTATFTSIGALSAGSLTTGGDVTGTSAGNASLAGPSTVGGVLNVTAGDALSLSSTTVGVTLTGMSGSALTFSGLSVAGAGTLTAGGGINAGAGNSFNSLTLTAGDSIVALGTSTHITANGGITFTVPAGKKVGDAGASLLVLPDNPLPAITFNSGACSVADGCFINQGLSSAAAEINDLLIGIQAALVTEQSGPSELLTSGVLPENIFKSLGSQVLEITGGGVLFGVEGVEPVGVQILEPVGGGEPAPGVIETPGGPGLGAPEVPTEKEKKAKPEDDEKKKKKNN